MNELNPKEALDLDEFDSSTRNQREERHKKNSEGNLLCFAFLCVVYEYKYESNKTNSVSAAGT